MKKYKQIYEFYLEKDEECLIEDLVPEYYIKQNLKKNKVGVNYAIRFLQNELNLILNSFLNGGFSYRGFVLYPFVKDLSKDNIKRVEILREIVIFLDNNGYDFSNSIKKDMRGINSKNFACLTSSLYKDFSLIKNNAITTKKVKCSELRLNEYKKEDLEYLRPLNMLKNYANKNLKKYLAGFYLHGSIATKDYVRGWSDIDTLGIVSKRTINNPKALLELRDKLYYARKFFYMIDPLQHHGSIIISEYDLNNYCQTYFPLPIFNYSKSFFTDSYISNFRVRDFSKESITRLFLFVSYFRKLYIEKKFNLNSYGTKNLLHSTTLFPAIYLQANGMLVYKKFSFDIAKKDFRKDIWEVIDYVSSIRSKWKDYGRLPLVSFFSNLNPLLCYQLNSRVMDLFKDIKGYNKIDTKRIIEGMFKLSEEAWVKVKENVKSGKL